MFRVFYVAYFSESDWKSVHVFNLLKKFDTNNPITVIALTNSLAIKLGMQ